MITPSVFIWAGKAGSAPSKTLPVAAAQAAPSEATWGRRKGRICVRSAYCPSIRRIGFVIAPGLSKIFTLISVFSSSGYSPLSYSLNPFRANAFFSASAVILRGCFVIFVILFPSDQILFAICQPSRIASPIFLLSLQRIFILLSPIR